MSKYEMIKASIDALQTNISWPKHILTHKFLYIHNCIICKLPLQHNTCSTLLFVGATCKRIDLIALTYQLKSLVCSWTQVVRWMDGASLHQRSKSSGVRRLRYDDNSAIRILPPSLTQLTFGDEFKQPLQEGVLPSSLTQLTFGSEFNQPLQEGVLPSSLTQLIFGYDFNQPLQEGVLPSSLIQLTFGWKFNQPLQEGVLPSGICSSLCISIISLYVQKMK